MNRATKVGLMGPLRLHHLEGHVAIECELAGEVNRPDRAAAELRTDEAAAENCGDRRGPRRTELQGP